jgi:hypothetical protein
MFLFLYNPISQGQEYVWGEEFQEGDIISAATFNQIFNTLEKINRTVKDEDLIGTWSCDAMTTRATDGWINKGAFYQLTNSQVTFTSSGSSSSIESPYSISTSAPSPFKRILGGFSGVYSLVNNMIFTKISGENESRIFFVDIKSEDKIDLTFQETSAQSFPATYASYISCTSATPVPAAPTNTIATNAQTTMNVAWTDQSTDETGFTIYRRLSNETTETQLVTAVTASPYVDSSLTEGQTAYYRVSAYNSYGESHKSGVSSATLDNTKPTVLSHTPTLNQQVSTTSRTLSIVFSENIQVICPADGSINHMCSTPGSAITVIGSSGKTYGSILSNGSSGLSFNGALVGSAEILNTNDTITVTVHKEWIKDANGNQMNADYSYSFTTGT